MRIIRMLVVMVLTLGGLPVLSQSGQDVILNLKDQWLITDGRGYQPYRNSAVKKIFFSIEASQFKGDFLFLSDNKPFAVFIDQKLIAERNDGALKLDLDSIGRRYSQKLSFGVFQRDGVTSLSSVILGPPAAVSVMDDEIILRKGNFFLDFSLIATLIMAVYLAVLLRTNPRLTLDYLNVYKLFSAQEREENLLTSRVTSRVNLLFYLFCSLFCSLILLVVFQLSNNTIPLAIWFSVRSTAEGFLQWLKLSLIIAALLAIKLTVVFLFSSLFDLRGKAPIQYFNFIRALFLAAGLIALICAINFILHGQYGGLNSMWLKIGAAVMVLSAIMMYLKLLAMTRYHFFHLFSYLCASEIIPLVILLKTLLY